MEDNPAVANLTTGENSNVSGLDGSNVTVTTPTNPPSDDINFEGRLLKPHELLSMAWALYKSRFWLLTAAVILMAIPVYAVSAGLAALLVRFIWEANVLVVLLLVGGIIGMAILGTWQSLAILYLIDGIKSGTGLREAYGKARGKIFRYWWLIGLMGLITYGAFIPLVIPGVILSVAFTYSVFILLLEDKGGLTALLRSREYVKGRWMAVAGRQFYPSLIIIAVEIPLLILIVVVSGGNKQIIDLMQTIITLIMTPLPVLMIIYTYLIYKNLKALHPETETVVKGKAGWYVLSVWGAIAPILIMAAVLTTLLNPIKQFNSLTDLTRITELAKTQTAIEAYYARQLQYPQSLDDLYLSGEIATETLDNLKEKKYRYALLDLGTNYQLCVVLSSGKDECLSARSEEYQNFDE